jgi:multidrug efflux pump subunit AcrA (membrane-fusion protein)
MTSSTPGTRRIAQTAVDSAADQSDTGPSPRCERTGLGFRAAFLGAACIGLLALAACDEQAEAPPPKPAVGVRPAAMKGVSESFEFVGHIQAIYKVGLRARIEGFLEKVLFREGQDVKVGDLLYQIEKIQFQTEVDQPRRTLSRLRLKQPTPDFSTAGISLCRRNSSVRSRWLTARRPAGIAIGRKSCRRVPH